ncbi:MAG: glycosyltransferase [Bdellovibrionales bacterium]|nr:glycosyltransferase [Bdellovibrionales bacterium]
MARIAINSAGSLGDINPFTLLAVELKKRGHDVVFSTVEFYRDSIQKLGLEFQPIRPNLSPEDQELARKIMDPEKGTQFLLKEICIPNLRQNYQDVATAATGADLIISGSLAFAVYLVHHKTKTPWVSVALQPYVYLSPHDFPVIAHLPGLQRMTSQSVWFSRLVIKLARALLDSWSSPWFQLLRELKIPKANVLDAQFSPQLQLAAFSPMFSGRNQDWPGHRKHVGFFQPPPREVPLSEGTEKFLAAGVSPLIFTLGSTAVLLGDTFFDLAIDFAKDTGQRTMLVCGKRADLLRERTKEYSHIYVADREPYSSLFPRGRAVIHQGGVGTTGEALRAGVPSLVVPFGADQYDNGHLIMRMGCGKSVPMKHLTLPILKNTLSNVLTEAMIARTREISSQIREERGVVAAADEIENFLNCPPRLY